VNVGQLRQIGHGRAPLPEVACCNPWLRPMVDHDRQFRMPPRESREGREVRRHDERVEPQLMDDHRRYGRVKDQIVNPSHVRDVLEHRPESLELRMRCKPGDMGWCVESLEVDPSHDA
jgi:hypothetical protein